MSNRARLSLDHRELLFALDELIRTMPEGEAIRGATLENHDWVGRARALIAAWDESRESSFNTWCDSLFARTNNAGGDRYAALTNLAKIMNTIQEARNELRLVTGGRKSEAFDAGQPYAFYDELRKLIETAQREVFFVDRWMGADFVSSYLPHVRSGVSIRLLTRDLLDKLAASVAVFIQQKPAQIAIRSSQNFHGRFLCIDGVRAFLVDASFKDAAKSAPAALVELTDIAADAVRQYQAIWDAAAIVQAP